MPGTPLGRLDPLSKVLAVLPALLVLCLTRDPWTPSAFVVGCVLLLALAGGLGVRRLLTLVAALLAGTAVATAGFSVAAGGLLPGMTTALRLVSLVGLVLLSSQTTAATDLVLALQQHLRVPYRVAHAALAGVHMIPRLAADLEVIRLAHRVRGSVTGRGPLAALRRQAGYAVPLLAGGIRHAERVAVSMDARAFGASSRRTERKVLRWRAADVGFVTAFWIGSAGIFWLSGRLGLLAPLSFW